METTNDKANLPLQPIWKLMAFMLPFFIFFLNPWAFSPKKYKRRYEETWLWVIIGVFFWGLMAWVLIGFKSVSG
jgi:hypothetical protein